MPAQPIATSHCPWRQARPKLSVISTATRAPVSSRRRARSASRRGVGVAGQEHERVGSPSARRWRRRRRRWRTRSRGGCGRSARRARRARSRRTGRARPGPRAGPCPAAVGQLAARARRARTSASATTAPSALETTLCAIATIWPSRSGSAADSRRTSAATISAPRSSPGRTSGRPLRARGAEARHGARRRSGRMLAQPVSAMGVTSESRRPSTARVRGAPAWRPRTALAQRARGRRRCRCRAAATAGARSGSHAALRARARGGARSCPGRSWARSRPGGVSSRPFVPVPWRSGTITTAGVPLPARELSSAVELGRVQGGAVAGDAQHALEPLGEGALDAEGDRRALALLGACPRRRARPGSAPARRPSPRA